ncbi:hypothetical protein ABIA39_008998 [Nocardia sp. GAS34]|jgi:hypothetical protein|uniref:DUF5994 family protein n=1 Tax=unclassified Nocardia TaxID=2637762 RepID=UPI003D1C215A
MERGGTSDDLATELPVLLTALNSVLGAVERVVYHLGEWSSAPGELAFAGRVVRLDGYRHCTVDTIEVPGPGNRRRVLLVVPPNTDAHHAFAAMTSAADHDDLEQRSGIGSAAASVASPNRTLLVDPQGISCR